MSKVDGKICQKLFCMGTRADPQDPVFTKDKKKFKQFYTEVYKSMGKRLGHITHHEGVVDWSASGVFKLCKEGAGDTFAHLQHLSGEKLKLPSTLRRRFFFSQQRSCSLATDGSRVGLKDVLAGIVYAGVAGTGQCMWVPPQVRLQKT